MSSIIPQYPDINNSNGFNYAGFNLEDITDRAPIGHSPLARDFHAPVQNHLLFLTELLKKNYLINGSMKMLNRYNNTHNTFSTLTADAVAFDRWKISTENASLQATRWDTDTGGAESGLASRFYATYKKITNTGKFFVRQILSGEDSKRFIASGNALFQLKIKTDSARTIRIGVLYLDSNGTLDTIPATPSAWNANSTDPTFGTHVAPQAPTSAVNAAVSGNAASIAATTAWKTVTVFATSIPSTAKNIILGIWTDSQVAANATISIAEAFAVPDVTINAAPLLTSGALFAQHNYLERQDKLDEERNKKFFLKTYDPDDYPAKATLAGSLEYCAAIAGVLQQGALWQFQTTMRARPTVTMYNPAAANAKWRNQTQGADSATAGFNSIGKNSVLILNPQVSGEAAGDMLSVHATAEAEL